MILGLGSDIVEIKRIKKIMEKTGDRFLEKNYTTNEIKEYEERFSSENEKGKIGYLARRFAAKEAFSKAIGTGIGAGALFKEISIENDESGKPFISLSGSAKATLDKISPKGKKAICHVSLSDTKKIAQAVVIISTD